MKLFQILLLVLVFTCKRVNNVALANAAEDMNIIGLGNELMIDSDGWVTIPYGDSKHSGKDGRSANSADLTPEQLAAERAGVIQRFSREDAIAMVNDFKSTWSRLKRAVVGLPVFKGHPDAPRFAKRFPDKTPRGTIADMEARESGLALRPVLTEQGATDVEAGHRYVSPYWLGAAKAEENGRKVVSPYKLISLGLVEKGNIPGLSLVNTAEPENDSPMKPHLIKILAALGLTVTAESDDTALANASETALTTITTLKADKTKLEGSVTTLTGEKTALANSVDTEKTRANTAETNLKNERLARSKTVIALAVKAGRIPVGETEAKTTALANATDFDGEVKKIEALPSRLRTESRLAGLGRSGNEQQADQTTLLGLINAAEGAPEIKSLPAAQRYDAAYSKVMADPKNEALVAKMKRGGNAPA